MGMRMLVVGSGGREHAIAWKLAQSPNADDVHCAPGNPGIASVATCHPVDPNDVDGIIALAREHRIDLVVVGPEEPLARGLADRLTEAGFAVAGHSAAATRIESSKSFAKEVMEAANVPTSRSRSVTDRDEGLAAIRELCGGQRIVIKADGLAAGKGVIVAANADDGAVALETLLSTPSSDDEPRRVLIEECLDGPEISVICLVSGTTIVPLAPSCDYKCAYDNDEGPNTGGMGAYTPTRLADDAMMQRIHETILQPVVDEMARRGTPLRGVLYAGLMQTADGPKVIEFNARFGDPETQVLLPTMDGDLASLLMAVADGTLADHPAPGTLGSAVGITLASEGYPGTYRKGLPITGLDDVVDEQTIVFHAGTARNEAGEIVTNGGRVLTVVGLGDSIAGARDRAYAAAKGITFDGVQMRSDIAAREA